MSLFISQTLKFFFLLTPFFGLSMFISMTSGYPPRERRLLALRVALAAIVIGLILFFFGGSIFSLFGITVDAFRIGAGALLFLSAVALMNPKVDPDERKPGTDIAVVPLAMPVIIGPATCGPLLVMGADLGDWTSRLVAMAAMTVALYVLWVILRMAAWLEKHIGLQGLSILMRLTGLILSALSAQMIMTGVVAFLKE